MPIQGNFDREIKQMEGLTDNENILRIQKELNDLRDDVKDIKEALEILIKKIRGR